MYFLYGLAVYKIMKSKGHTVIHFVYPYIFFHKVQTPLYVYYDRVKKDFLCIPFLVGFQLKIHNEENNIYVYYDRVNPHKDYSKVIDAQYSRLCKNPRDSAIQDTLKSKPCIYAQ